MAAILGVFVLDGLGLLGVRLGPYWIAKYRGNGAHLHGAMLAFAPLAGANLAMADLRRANLRGADLRAAMLLDADPRGADLRGADLRGTPLGHITDLVTISIEDRSGRVVATRGLDPNLVGARYDRYTRWPAGFDPARHGAFGVE